MKYWVKNVTAIIQQQMFQAGLAGQDWFTISGYGHASIKEIVFPMQFANEKVKKNRPRVWLTRGIFELNIENA